MALPLDRPRIRPRIRLYFHRTRFYSPTLMRFIQEDPAGWAGGPNLYAYGNGDPTYGRDPDGLSQDYDLQARPTEEQMAMYSCLGTFNGCSQEGASWTAGEGWRPMRARGVTAAERDAERAFRQIDIAVQYTQYLEAYRRRAEQRRAGDAVHPWDTGVIRPLEEDEFTLVIQAVEHYAVHGPNALEARLGVDGVFMGGIVGVDQYSWHTNGTTLGATWDAPRFGMIVLNPAVFTRSAALIANVMVHEMRHAYASDESHCSIYAYANAVTGLTVPCG